MTTTNRNATKVPEYSWYVLSCGEVAGRFATGAEAEAEARTLREDYGCDARAVAIPAR